ncbi:MAG TPA: hypothetical protein VL485_03285 [Ktedonobacteraceae bacterium]|jgi:hypothetical protein|nr:hypothetical protein [Ktedonobacteraceae bacterium]
MRLLLPFTHTVEVEAIDDAMRVAVAQSATLVPLSLSVSPDGQTQRCGGPETLAQTRHFHAVTQTLARHYHVSLERLEISSHDPLRSIIALAGEYRCDAILIFLRAGQGVMLETSLLRQLMEQSTCNLYFVRLSSPPAGQTSDHSKIGLFRRFRRQTCRSMTLRFSALSKRL